MALKREIWAFYDPVAYLLAELPTRRTAYLLARLPTYSQNCLPTRKASYLLPTRRTAYLLARLPTYSQNCLPTRRTAYLLAELPTRKASYLLAELPTYRQLPTRETTPYYQRRRRRRRLRLAATGDGETYGNGETLRQRRDLTATARPYGIRHEKLYLPQIEQP
jgi:hypothetical protein